MIGVAARAIAANSPAASMSAGGSHLKCQPWPMMANPATSKLTAASCHSDAGALADSNCNEPHACAAGSRIHAMTSAAGNCHAGTLVDNWRQLP